MNGKKDFDDEEIDSDSMSMSSQLNGSGKYNSEDLNASTTASHSGKNASTRGGGGDDMFENTQRGDKIISASRCVFFSVLFVAAAVLATVAFLLYRAEETQNFIRSFENRAEEIMLYTNHNVDTAFATLRGLATSTTTLSKRFVEATGMPPGFVTLPDIEFHLGLAKNTTGALVISYQPKVMNEDYDTWIAFSEDQKGWISTDQPGGPVDYLPVIPDVIWQWVDEDELDGHSLVDFVNEVHEQTMADGTYSTTTTTSQEKKPVSIEELDEEQDDTNTTEVDSPEESDVGEDRRAATRNLSVHGRNSVNLRSLQGKSPDCSTSSGRRRNRRSLQGVNTDPTADEKIEELRQEFDDANVTIAVEAPKDAEFWTPVWQLVPVPLINKTHNVVDIINYNLLDREVFARATDYMEKTRDPLFLDVCDQAAWYGYAEHADTLQTVVAFPVMEDFQPDSPVVGYYAAIIPWLEFFDNHFTDSNDYDGKQQNVTIVVENDCDEVFTVEMGYGYIEIFDDVDLHDPNYDHISETELFAPEWNNYKDQSYDGEICIYTMTIYPSKSFEDTYRTNRPAIISMLIVLVFLFTSLAFMLFDCLVTRRQAKLLNTAMRQNAIVSSLFPKSVQKKLMEEAEVKAKETGKGKINPRSLGTFLNEDGNVKEKSVSLDSKPIADLFPKTTIMFADIAGFTAWSSAREPEAVFTLLETIYRAFDMIAKRRRVFKVEVVGDCYVAVCGLPDPRKDHFSVMCKFANDCLSAMQTLVKELEVKLGPDTGDLRLRTGLHSGPVVAGVLRGEKSRFQLFGDTMNTASRMESNGIPNKIQLSQSTADLLIDAGKEHWIVKRPDKIKAKGKGELTTYFLLPMGKKSSDQGKNDRDSVRQTVVLGHKDNTVDDQGNATTVRRVQQRNRVADWVVEMLGKLLKEMKAKRETMGVKRDTEETMSALELETEMKSPEEGTVIDEVADCLKLPVYSASSASTNGNANAQVSQDVMDELQDYVYSIASMYNKNPFHNFEHASHVSMSCIKLLNRIASRDEDFHDGSDHTFGICNDPLTSFAIVFSALIHDVDHSGAPNMQLVKEHAPVAAVYKNKSVAEQNSIDIGWGLLMEPTYKNLRRHIYTTKDEYRCFRQLVVNCVMATDICDKDLIKDRNKRWELAFAHSNNGENGNSGGNGLFESVRQVNNRKGTVVIEHLIQLSDVAHTMQHWHIYRRWNERLFEESYVAYADCRADKNPATNWYQGELGFYDFYIIPLAKKIKQCQVFGVSSDEYLSYAMQNRAEWEERGKELVEEMAKKMEAIHHAGISRQLLELEMDAPVTAQSMTTGTQAVKRFNHY